MELFHEDRKLPVNELILVAKAPIFHNLGVSLTHMHPDIEDLHTDLVDICLITSH